MFSIIWSEKYQFIQNKIRYFKIRKCCVTYVLTYKYEKIKIDSCGSLHLGEALTLDNVIMFIKSVLNKNRNLHYYNMLLEECLYQLTKR